MKRIPLRDRNGGVRAHAVVNDADFDWLNQWRWCLSSVGYAMRGNWGSSNVLMHRQILGLEAGDPRQGDHRNRDRLDNRKANLRVVGRTDNQQNLGLRSDNTSGYRGVVRHKAKWEAFAKQNGKRLYLGLYDSPADADVAAKAWRAEHMPFSEDAASVAAV